MRGDIHSRPRAFAAAFRKKCLMPSSDMHPLRSAVATASLRLGIRLKSFANFLGIDENPAVAFALARFADIG